MLELPAAAAPPQAVAPVADASKKGRKDEKAPAVAPPPPAIAPATRAAVCRSPATRRCRQSRGCAADPGETRRERADARRARHRPWHPSCAREALAGGRGVARRGHPPRSGERGRHERTRRRAARGRPLQGRRGDLPARARGGPGSTTARIAISRCCSTSTCGVRPRRLQHFEAYARRKSGTADRQVSGWIAELKRRVGDVAQTADVQP